MMPAKKSGKLNSSKAKRSRSTQGDTQPAKQQMEADGLTLLRAQNQEIRQLAQKVAQEIRRSAGSAQSNGQNQGAAAAGSEDTRDEKQALQLDGLRELCRRWLTHHHLSQDVAWPQFEAHGIAQASLWRVALEHDLALTVLADMIPRAEGDLLVAEAAAFCEMVPRIARLEETQIIGKAKKAGIDAAELGRQLKEAMEEMQEEYEDAAYVPAPRHLKAQRFGSKKENDQMAMRGQNRNRDEYGRFTDDDDDHRGRGRGGYSSRGSSSSSSSRSSRQDDDDGRGWYGDSRGHSEAARRGWEERRGSSGGGRYEEDDDDYRGSSSRGRSSSGGGGGRRSGGWFGDSEGHSQASRRGWQNPDHGQSGWYGDSEGHSQASRRGWQNPDHGQSGWYGDSEGHSQASRRGWQNPDHGESGWFGDREGHSQASRRGWDNPEHGESGWFGDPEGHSEASRRGWRSRRDDDDDNGRRSSRRGRG